MKNPDEQRSKAPGVAWKITFSGAVQQSRGQMTKAKSSLEIQNFLQKSNILNAGHTIITGIISTEPLWDCHSYKHAFCSPCLLQQPQLSLSSTCLILQGSFDLSANHPGLRIAFGQFFFSKDSSKECMHVALILLITYERKQETKWYICPFLQRHIVSCHYQQIKLFT